MLCFAVLDEAAVTIPFNLSLMSTKEHQVCADDKVSSFASHVSVQYAADEVLHWGTSVGVLQPAARSASRA